MQQTHNIVLLYNAIYLQGFFYQCVYYNMILIWHKVSNVFYIDKLGLLTGFYR